MRYFRDTVTQKYSNLPGIHSHHDFLAIKNPGTSAIMKVCELCYSGTLQNTPMHLTRGYTHELWPSQLLVIPMLLGERPSSCLTPNLVM